MRDNQNNDPHKGEPVYYAGERIEKAKAAMIMIHGRGASAESILSLSDEFNIPGFAFAAPQAAGYTWYPYSFLYPIKKNEPGVSSGLKSIDKLVKSMHEKGIKKNKIILLGFSQGACLTLEYTARNPIKYGGVFGLSGGLIGEEINENNYSGSLEGTPVFLGCSNIDPHIPEERVHLSAEIFRKLNANVNLKIYPDMGHTINEDEIKEIKAVMEMVI